MKYKENGRTITKRVPLDSEFSDSYEDELRRRFGDARAKKIQNFANPYKIK